jgi:hypothetical protein
VLLAACGTGNRIDVSEDGGGDYLPVVNVATSPQIPLTEGEFSGDGNDQLITDETSGTTVRIHDGSLILNLNPAIYDFDLDGTIDYISVTIRPLSAQAAGNTTRYDEDDNPLSSDDFIKVGGAAFLPMEATFDPHVSLTLPVHPSAGVSVGDSLDVYRFVDVGEYHNPSADVGTGTGYWKLIATEAVDDTGTHLTFKTQQFGQYCVATSEIIHDQGTGGDT